MSTLHSKHNTPAHNAPEPDVGRAPIPRDTSPRAPTNELRRELAEWEGGAKGSITRNTIRCNGMCVSVYVCVCVCACELLTRSLEKRGRPTRRTHYTVHSDAAKSVPAPLPPHPTGAHSHTHTHTHTHNEINRMRAPNVYWKERGVAAV